MVEDDWDALAVDVRRDADRIVITPQGDLDISNVEQLYAAFAQRGPGEGLVLDLGRLDFLDTSGLQAVVEVHRAASEQGFPLTVVRGPRHITRVFQIAGLDDRLPFVDAAERPGGG
jgi:anti-sigma B factor antagonist